jgi:hypothetical protein
MIQKIEQALNIKLYPWQIDYLLKGHPMPRDRGNGKTLAHCIRLALSDGKPLDMQKPENFCDNDYGPEDNKTSYARKYFRRMFLDVREQLMECGLKVREVK